MFVLLVLIDLLRLFIKPIIKAISVITKMEHSPTITTLIQSSTLSNPGAIHFVIFSDDKKNSNDKRIQAARYFMTYIEKGFKFYYFLYFISAGA